LSKEQASNTTAAAVALLRKSVEIAKREYDAAPTESVLLGQEWQPLSRAADSVVFRLMRSTVDAQALAISTAMGELRESPEAAAFAEAVAQDATLAPYLDKLAFSGGIGMQMNAEAMTAALIEFGLRNRDWDAVPDAAPEIFADFINALLREHDQLTLVAPLQNFVGPTEEVALGEGLVIDGMRDDEISRAISAGVLTHPFQGATHGDVWVTSLWAVRMTYAEERIFATAGESPPPNLVQERHDRVAAMVDRVVHALLLFKSGFVSAESGVLFASEAFEPLAAGWLGRWIFGTKAGRHGPNYELQADEAEEFRHFYNALVQARTVHPALDVAVRRYGDAVGRTRPDDQLTDLIIALEALLLTDSERGEKRFQVALRVAAYLERGETKRRDILGFVKRAYDVRSSIVHGGAPRQRDLRNISGEGVELQAFADEAMDVVRDLLRQVTEEIEETGELAVDWEARLLGDE
jgi:hypothetical protein